MARKNYNKLVRDRIPDIIRSEGRDCATEIMTESDYRRALVQKLVEEAQEVGDAPPDMLVTELADLLEVFDAVRTAHGIRQEDILVVQNERRTQRGGFDKRIRLLWAD